MRAITKNTESVIEPSGKEEEMEERTYKLMGGVGKMSLAAGIVNIVLGTAVGVVLIINGAKLLGGRKKFLI